jgi:hypothetical protein
MERLTYPDLMVDVETTGLTPHACAIIQIGAVPFNYETGAIDSNNMYKRSLMIPKNRYWTDDTQRFWMVDNAEVYQSIMEQASNPYIAFREFYDWVLGLGEVRFWSKGMLDWNMIESYCKSYDFDMPFNFRQVKDMRSFIAGLYGDAEYREPVVDKVGNHHDALHDCLTQLKILFKAKEETCQSVVISA